MYPKQCKRCIKGFYDPKHTTCLDNEHTKIVNIVECKYANDGKGGIDFRIPNTIFFLNKPVNI